MSKRAQALAALATLGRPALSRELARRLNWPLEQAYNTLRGLRDESKCQAEKDASGHWRYSVLGSSRPTPSDGRQAAGERKKGKRVRRPNIDPPAAGSTLLHIPPCPLKWPGYLIRRRQRIPTIVRPEAADWRWSVR